MKKITKYIVLIVIVLTAFSCEEVVNVDLDTENPKLVIDASIKWKKGTDGKTQKIVLTTTTDYYSNTIPVATGAQITVKNVSLSSPITYSFIEDGQTGMYICNNFGPKIGNEYELIIKYKNQNYTSKSTLTATPKIENIEQILKPGFGGEDFIQIKFHFQDNGNEDNYYLGGIKNSTLVIPEYGVIDDRFTQGNLMYISYQDDLKKDDVVDYSLQGITKSYANYMSKLIAISGDQSGSPFATPPATLRGNVVNTTNSENYPLGYFQLSEIDSGSYTVK
jgi:hypothetical protein